MFAGEVAFDQLGWICVTSATVLDLVDRGHRGCEIIGRAYIVRRAVAIGADRGARVRAASERAKYRAMAFAARRFVR